MRRSLVALALVVAIVVATASAAVPGVTASDPQPGIDHTSSPESVTVEPGETFSVTYTIHNTGEQRLELTSLVLNKTGPLVVENVSGDGSMQPNRMFGAFETHQTRTVTYRFRVPEAVGETDIAIESIAVGTKDYKVTDTETVTVHVDEGGWLGSWGLDTDSWFGGDDSEDDGGFWESIFGSDDSEE